MHHFLHYNCYTFSIFFVLCTMGRASKKILVDKGAIVTLRDKSLTHNCSTIWCGTEKDRPHGL